MLWCGCLVEAPTNMGRKSQTHDPSRFLRASGVSYGCGLRGAWWRGGDGSRRRERGRGGVWGLSLTGLQTGQYLVDGFGACGRDGSVRGWGRVLGLGWLCGRGGVWGGGGGGGGRGGKGVARGGGGRGGGWGG